MFDWCLSILIDASLDDAAMLQLTPYVECKHFVKSDQLMPLFFGWHLYRWLSWALNWPLMWRQPDTEASVNINLLSIGSVSQTSQIWKRDSFSRVNSIFIIKFYSTISHCRLLTEVPRHEELVNELGGDNCTALYYAASAGNQEVAKILLEKGGKKTIDAQDNNGQTALHLAIMTGNL